MASNIPDDGKTCPVCFETYKKPKILTCGHTFCETCIHEYILKSKKERLSRKGIECPLCRTLTPAQSDPMQPEKWAKSLSSNFALESILAASVDGKERNEEKDAHNDSEYHFVCQPCLDHEKHVRAKVFCVDCSRYQCSECANMHAKFEKMKNHVFTDITGNEDKANFLSYVNKIQFCQTHQKKFKYTCLTHDKLCCSACLIESHKKCNEVSIETASKELSLEKMKKSMLDLNIKVKSASDFWSGRRVNIKSQAQSLRSEIQAKRETVMKMFDAFEKHSMSMLELENNARISEYNKNQENCEILSANIDNTVSLCETAMKYGTPVQKYILSRHLKTKCSDIYSRSGKAFNELASLKVMINFLPIGDEKQKLSEQLGSLFFFSSPINIDEIDDHMNSRLKLKCSTEQSSSSWYRSIDFLADGRLVGVDQFKHKLVLFDNELNCIFDQDLDVRPFSVKTLSTNDTILVTTGDAKQLLVFELKADDTIYFVKSIQMKRCFDTIAPADDRTFFVRLFGCRKPLGLVSLDGSEKDISIDLPEKEYTAENSKCAFDIESRKLAFSDKNGDTVFIVDIKNNQTTAIQSESIMQPREVVFGSDDTLFICSGGTNSIVHATTDGEVLTSGRLKTAHPYALCISKDKRQLAVANMEINKKQISVFDIL